ncbi:MAG: electron transfer flavoprotein subunit beta/FixA family protein [Actinomycetota bacterium]
MRILVCVKRVPAPGARINVSADGQSIETAHLGFTTSPHEECALEEAVLLTEQHGGTVTVLTLGPPEAEEQLRYAASVGAHEIVLIPNGPEGSVEPWDPQRTAAALTEAIESIESDSGPFDLIMFGNESADSGGFQVGVRVAYKLSRPIVNGIKDVELAMDGDSVTGVTARRAVDAGFEVYELPTPAVLGVKEGLNLPRYPTMKGRLASKKVEMSSLSIDADEGGQAMVSLHQPEEQVSKTEILGDSEEAAVKVVDLLEELGVLGS